MKGTAMAESSAVGNPSSPIGLIDLGKQYACIRYEIAQALQDVAESGVYVLGPKVEEFEQAFSRYTGSQHCIGVNSGTSALHLALLCAGVGAGDEVITVPMTFVATAWAITYTGAVPVFVDIDPYTHTMDVTEVERRITERTRAILPVHLYGQAADMDPLRALCEKYGLALIEDAAQAHGAEYYGRRVGTIGDIGCFSFYPGKNLGAYGEAGALITNDSSVANRARALRDHAQSQRYHHDEIGFNYRMDAFQGAILSVKLRYLDQWTDERGRLAQRYRDGLDNSGVGVPLEGTGRRHAWHLFVITHSARDHVRRRLEAQSIQTGLHYPVPVHLQKAYASLGHQRGDFPVTEKLAGQCLSLPLFPELSEVQQERVIRAVREAVV
jgi:dTDP-4-amino-4,6-dideoxygalactose transaminase